jgi:hypothetical protein
VDHVEQFISTYSMKSETARVKDRMVDFSTLGISRILRLPREGLLLDQMPGVAPEQEEEIFDGEYPRTEKGGQIDKARHHWRPWFKFVNDYLFFRPQKDWISLTAITAAVNVWQGQKMNWAQIVQHNMDSELSIKLKAKPAVVELFSAFYITELCRELPAPAFEVGGPSTLRETPSPLSSPETEKEEDEEDEIQRLTARLRTAQTLANEKQDQLWEKNEALIKCQTENVKNLHEVAQLMREKMDAMTSLEAGRKELEARRSEVELKDREIQQLKTQLQEPFRLQEQFEECQRTLQQAQQDNSQLRGELQRRQEELEQSRAMVSHVSTIGQPSITSAMDEPEKLVTPTAEFFNALWFWESQGSVPRDIFQLYEQQRDLLFLTLGVTRSECLDHSHFHRLWRQSVQLGVENLFTETLARKEIQLSDPHSAFLIIGDIGARILLYYAQLESQWSSRKLRQNEREDRVVTWQDYSLQITSQFYGQPVAILQGWREILVGLNQKLQQPEFLSALLTNNVQRMSIASSVNLTGSHYLFHHSKTVNRLERYIREVSTQKRPLLNVNGQIQMELPPLSFSVAHPIVELPLVGSPLTLRYLGQYAKMFDTPAEEPVLTWTAISWMLEDYGLSRTEEVPADIVYWQNSRQWSHNPPPAVANHPNFCPCQRRCKWNPQATLTSVEYNWPFIPGPMSTADECKSTYKRFFEIHIQHLDPVCFRAAVFCNTLADWCGQWNVVLNVNKFAESHYEFLLLLKLQYRPTRWVRMVEAMAITHFIAGAHRCLINEFPHTRAGPFDRFLRWQRLNAPALVAQDEDLQRAMDKLEIRDWKRTSERTSSRPESTFKYPRC